jgi:Flp pilus assembly protein TadG
MRTGRKGNERGNAMVELSLAFPVCAVLLFGVFQFGYAFFEYSKLQTAVRAGARYAAMRTYDSSTSTPSTAYVTAVRNVVLYGDPAGAAEPVVKGLSAPDIAVEITMAENVPEEVAVKVANYTFDAIFTRFNWRGKPAAHFRYQGRYSPR